MRNSLDTVAMLVPHAASNVNGPWVALDNATDYGLIVPTLGNACTVTFQVASKSDGSDGQGLVDGTGTALLVLASGGGAVCVSSDALRVIKGYPFGRVVLGANQAGDVTFTLTRKVVAADNFA